MKQVRFAITGQPGSGKTRFGEFLVDKHGFSELTGSEYLKEEAARLGITLRERSDYGNLQRTIRTQRSASFITDLLLEMPQPRVLNVGLRNRYDALAHLSANGIIIALHCPDVMRHKRTAGTDSKYPWDFNEFIAAELPEYNSPDPFGQHTKWVTDNATHTIDSSQPPEFVERALDEIVAIHCD